MSPFQQHYQARWIQLQLILYHFVAAWMEPLWENQCIWNTPPNLGCKQNLWPAVWHLRHHVLSVNAFHLSNVVPVPPTLFHNKQNVRSNKKTSAKSKAQISSLFVFQVSKALPFQVSLQDQLLVQEDHQRKHPWPIVSPQLPSLKLDTMATIQNLSF